MHIFIHIFVKLKETANKFDLYLGLEGRLQCQSMMLQGLKALTSQTDRAKSGLI
jgi:hypothetical protein